MNEEAQEQPVPTVKLLFANQDQINAVLVTAQQDGIHDQIKAIAPGDHLAIIMKPGQRLVLEIGTPVDVPEDLQPAIDALNAEDALVVPQDDIPADPGSCLAPAEVQP